jgi:hypothetical protein
MGEIIRTEVEADHRYRIIRTDKGYLVTTRQRDTIGLLFGAEWLHRTPEAANPCLDCIMAFNASWRASRRGVPMQGLERRFDEADSRYRKVCEELNDEPLIGQEVRTVRQSVDDGSE